MDFFEHQEAARRSTRRLVLLFTLGVVGVILAVYVAFAIVLIPPTRYEGGRGAYAFELMTDPDSRRQRELGAADFLLDRPWWDPALFLSVAVGTSLVIGLGGVAKAAQLSSGGRAVASLLGGRLLEPNAGGMEERRLLNVVEEMSLAAGVPVPAVYLMSEEPGINAFAAGFSPADAVIGVTRGCMRLLSRDELQGVVAHEFSHILNGDMRLNMRLMAAVFGITMISSIGGAVLRLGAYAPRRRDDSRGGGMGAALLILGGLLYFVGCVGVFFGSLIRAAISRQREFLADAASVQFTRNADGIVGALKKIGGLAQGSRLIAPRAAEASHFYFGNGLRESFFNAFATHPPLVERILRIHPSFDGQFPEVVPEAVSYAAPQKAAPPRLTRPMNPSDFVAGIGMLTDTQVYYAEAMRRAMPDVLMAAAHEPAGACALVFGLLLSRDGIICASQLQSLKSRVDAAQFGETERLLPAVRALDPTLRLPLIDVAIQGLRQLSPAQFESFMTAVDELVWGDQGVDLFEFTLLRLFRCHIGPHFGGADRPQVRYRRWQPILPEALLLLSALAHAGTARDAEMAARAFRAGVAQLELRERGDWRVGDAAECCDLESISKALDRVNQATPWLKKNFLLAAATTVMEDREMSIEEGELLRAMADSLGCPVPPFARR